MSCGALSPRSAHSGALRRGGSGVGDGGGPVKLSIEKRLRDTAVPGLGRSRAQVEPWSTCRSYSG